MDPNAITYLENLIHAHFSNLDFQLNYTKGPLYTHSAMDSIYNDFVGKYPHYNDYTKIYKFAQRYYYHIRIVKFSGDESILHANYKREILFSYAFTASMVCIRPRKYQHPVFFLISCCCNFHYFLTCSKDICQASNC